MVVAGQKARPGFEGLGRGRPTLKLVPPSQSLEFRILESFLSAQCSDLHIRHARLETTEAKYIAVETDIRPHSISIAL
jgi:hypothetical protein